MQNRLNYKNKNKPHKDSNITTTDATVDINNINSNNNTNSVEINHTNTVDINNTNNVNINNNNTNTNMITNNEDREKYETKNISIHHIEDLDFELNKIYETLPPNTLFIVVTQGDLIRTKSLLCRKIRY